MTTPSLAISIGRSRSRLALLLIPLVFACFMLSPTARAVLPPPDGGYPNNNTAEGSGALFSLTTGTDNTAIGFAALYYNTGGGEFGNSNTAIGSQALFRNTTGSFNTAIGAHTLQNSSGLGFNTATGAFALMNSLGDLNTATGAYALIHNLNGYYNTATGVAALGGDYNTGDYNTATGYAALGGSNSGNYNTANGSEALGSNSTGSFNTASGVDALSKNTTGTNNTAIGVRALGGEGFTTGSFNTASGVDALNRNTTGHHNTGNGSQSLFNNTTGSKNSANGVSSLLSNTAGHDNVAFGLAALQNNTTGSFNIAIGSNAGANLTTGSDNIVIGQPGVAGETNTIRIGTAVRHTATYIAGIYGAAVPSGVTVIVGSDGHLGTVPSSERFKTGIATMDEASEAILSLRPVTFHYKADTEGTPRFGLIAEEVAKVNPDLVVRDENGEIYTVRYEAVNAMLLNEFLKEHRTVQEQKATIAELRQNFAQQQKQIEALTAGLQKVSAQLEASKPAPQVVNNN